MNSDSQVKPESFADNQSAEREIFRNNVNKPCIKYDGKAFTVEFINDGNLRKLSRIEDSKLPFTLDLEENGVGVFKCILRPDGTLNGDLSVVCVVHEKYTIWKCDDVRPYNVHDFQTEIVEFIRALSCKTIGVHIVAEWEDGGSDASDLSLYTAADFHRMFPDAPLADVLRFYEGKGDGFVVRIWTDEHGMKVTDRIYYCVDSPVDKGNMKITVEDIDDFLTIDMKIESLETLYSK